jgi:ATP-dependent Clp protease adaptor protein ClpS
MECCGHSYEQALQCTWIAHCFGKCDVKHGGYERLAPIAEKLTLRGLTVKII